MDTVTPIVEEVTPQQSFPFSLSPKAKLITLIIILAGALIAIIAGFFLFARNANAATIAGIINYTALKPDPTDKGTVYVKYRPYGSTGAYTTVYASALADKSPWLWKDAVSGKAYEMVAQLVVDGKVVTTSETHVVTAPAQDENLNLHVTWKDLPESVIQSQTASIKGTVNVEGVIPTGATILIQAEAPGSTTFTTQVTLTNPQLQNSWTWSKTMPLQNYVMRAILMQGNQTLGTSETLTAAGGDTAIAFTIDSSAPGGASPVATPTQAVGATTATPVPTGSVSISGSVDINGPEDKNTSLLMLWRKPGTSTYQPINRIMYPSHGGQAWSWSGLQPGQQYEITAVLQVNNNNTASTQSQIITAPATNINFVLNTGIFVPTPSSNVTVVSCNSVGSNQYNATISFSQQAKAGNYWIQVGTGQAWSDVYNNKVPANGNPQVTIQIQGGRSYYAQYAYSLCQNCSSNVNFSNFSQSLPFSCGGGSVYTGYVCNSNPYACAMTTQNNPPYPLNSSGLQQCQQQCIQPTNTPVPQPTNTPVPQPTSTPVPPTAIPTPTPKVSSCNQSCGGNGYTCVTGLSCVSSGGGIGSDVCRNPSCPDDQDCNCLTK